MIYPRIDQLLENVNERYALVIVAAKRARQINNYHHQLGEGTFDDNPPPLVESRSKNYLTMALEEIAEGKIKYTLQRLSRFASLAARRLVWWSPSASARGFGETPTPMKCRLPKWAECRDGAGPSWRHRWHRRLQSL